VSIDKQPTNQTESKRSGMSRRTVVKTGAHAAWAVPAISLATAAPAMASSGAVLSISGTSANRAVAILTASASVDNTGTQTTSGLQLIVDISSTSGNATGVTAATTPTGWGTPVKTNPGSQLARFTYTATGQLANGASQSFSGATYTIPIGQAGPGTITFLPADPGASVTSSGPVNFA